MKATLRKQQILECARRLFSRKGYYETHVESILREAGIGKGTFYQYFRNKEDLFVALLSAFLDEWEAAVLAASPAGINDALEAYYRGFIRRSLIFFRDNEDLCNIYLRIGPGISAAFEPLIARFETRMVAYVTDALRLGMCSGFFRQDFDSELVANLLVGGFLRLDYYYFLFKKDTPDIESMTAQFLDFVRRGIGA